MADQCSLEIVGPEVFIATMNKLRRLKIEIFEEQYDPDQGAIAETLRKLDVLNPTEGAKQRATLREQVMRFKEAQRIEDGGGDTHPTWAARIAYAEQWKKEHTKTT